MSFDARKPQFFNFVVEKAPDGVAIDKWKFLLFEDLRKSGKVNMCHTQVIIDLTGLTKWEINEIRKNYNHYFELYRL